MTTRRDLMKCLAGVGVAAAVTPATIATSVVGRDDEAVARRRIPASGELLPMVGLGTSRTFNVGRAGIKPVMDVMRAFLAAGGTLVDSSPMYGKAEEAVGAALDRLDRHDLFFATKVWTDEGREAGITQMNASIRKMSAPVMDLMQIHNLRDWEVHLPTLREWKEEGRIRYIGVTEMSDFTLVEKLMLEENLDFIQIPYSLSDRRVEERVLPAAQATETAVLVMRPFQRGELFKSVKVRAVPDWAAEFDCTSWAQFFLKFILGHEAVTCPIPATSKVHHLVDNMGAGVGSLPDAGTRNRMAALLAE